MGLLWGFFMARTETTSKIETYIEGKVIRDRAVKIYWETVTVYCEFTQNLQAASVTMHMSILVLIKVKWSRYRPGVALRVGRGIALLFHDCGTRREWVVSSTPRPHFTPGKEPVPIVQKVGWAPGPVWTGGKSLLLLTHWRNYDSFTKRER